MLVDYSKTSQLSSEQMKRIGNLYEKVCSRENIEKALYNAMKNKSNYQDVKKIKKNPEKYIDILEELLKNKKFVNGEYKVIKKQCGKKIREIHKLPFFPDRVVHHCIVQVVGDIWTKNLIVDTYSTIKGRGPHLASKKIKTFLTDKENTKYCLKLDVEKYYHTINNDILKTILRKKIKDNDLLNLIDTIIDGADGVPIGNYVSQWFGNLYLSYFDHWVKENLRCKYYIRYCDDMVLFSNNKETLRLWFNKIKKYLNENLKLKVKNNFAIFPIEKRGVDFLGYRFFPNYTLVRKNIIKSMKRCLDKPKSMSSYFGWIKHADSYRLLQKYYKNELYAKKHMYMNKFSDFASDEKSFIGDKIKIEEILEKDIVLHDYKETKSKYPEKGGGFCLTLSIEIVGNPQKNIIFTGSSVIANQCRKYKEMMPFSTKITKINKYYTFT